MSERRCRRVTSAALRDRLDQLSADHRDTNTAAEFLQQFEELGMEIGNSASATVERIVNRDGEALDYDTILPPRTILLLAATGAWIAPWTRSEFTRQFQGRGVSKARFR